MLFYRPTDEWENFGSCSHDHDVGKNPFDGVRCGQLHRTIVLEAKWTGTLG